MAKLSMTHAVRRWWRHLAAKVDVMHSEHADPKVQLEQAIHEAREQHDRLTRQAANVLANQQQAQLKLDRATTAYEKADALARQALLVVDGAARSGDTTKASRYAEAAESQAAKAIALEDELREREQALLVATRHADDAKAAVVQNGKLLQQKLEEREKVLDTLDRAQMQEAMNDAVRLLTSTMGEDVPTFEQVRIKVDKRLAVAQGMAALTAAQTVPRAELMTLELEQAQTSAAAQARLAALRLDMGLAEPAAIEAAPVIEVSATVVRLPGGEQR